jgi:hypothetical protein
MRIQVAFSIVDGYTTLKSKTVAVDVPDESNFMTVRDSMIKLVDLTKNCTFLDAGSDNVVEVMTALAIKKATEQGKIEGAAKAANGGDANEPWKLRAKISDLEQAVAKKDCQIDGLIKGVNPGYKTAFEKSTETLE